MLSPYNESLAEKKQVDGENVSILENAIEVTGNSETKSNLILLKTTSLRPSLKPECSQKIGAQVSSSDSSSTTFNLESRYESMNRLSRWFKGKRIAEIDPAVAQFPRLSFEVTKIFKRQKEQTRFLDLSENGISNIRPSNGKTSSVERWCDVVHCYKIDELTVAIKYTNSQRMYKTKTHEKSNELVNAVRKRVNAHQKYKRKQLQRSMVEGFDEKVKDEAVPLLKGEEYKQKNGKEIRETIEQILLCEKSQLFELKQKICHFPISDLTKVKELRSYLDQFKYKILDEYRKELWAKIDQKNPDENQYILRVIESVIENTCIPSHLDDIQKLLNKKRKTVPDLMTKLSLLNRKPQEFFGINKKMKSKKKWVNAVLELTDFTNKVLPSAKMQCLLNTAKHIHEEAEGYCREVMTGDDILPIVIYVIVKASWNVKKIVISEADEDFIDILCNAEALHGERGYYLCVFKAALEFIRIYDRKKIEERFNRIRRLKAMGFF